MSDKLIFVTDGLLSGATTVFHARTVAGLIYRKSTAAGGLDPAGYVVYSQTEANAGYYNLDTVEQGSSGVYVGTFPGGVAGWYGPFLATQGGQLVSLSSLPRYWDGTNLFSDIFEAAGSVESGWSLQQAVRVILAAAAGIEIRSGGFVKYRDMADSKDRLTADISGGRRVVTARDAS